MKFLIKYIAVLYLLMIFVSQPVHSQIKVSKVSNKNFNTSQDGFYYSLPQTVLKIDLVLEKIQKIPGPLSEYSKEYLGTSDYITTNSISYRLVHAEIEPVVTSVSADSPNSRK